MHQKFKCNSISFEQNIHDEYDILIIQLMIGSKIYFSAIKPCNGRTPDGRNSTVPLYLCSDFMFWSGLEVDDLAVFPNVFSNDSHFHLLSLLSAILILKLTVRKGQRSLIGGYGSRSYG